MIAVYKIRGIERLDSQTLFLKMGILNIRRRRFKMRRESLKEIYKTSFFNQR